MQRQSAPSDPVLTFWPPATTTVEKPRRRAPEPPEPGPVSPPATVGPAAAPVAEGVAPWAAPVPTFTLLCGAAGSGKTFLTRAWAEEEPGIVLAATTGIAAINLGGETINSVLGYFDTPSLQRSYSNGALTDRLARLWRCGVKRLIIDEVSMLGADQLSLLVRGIEDVNLSAPRKQSDLDQYGQPNLGLTLVGDFCQLPPVKELFAFEAKEWASFQPHVVTLTEIRRQADADFIQMLREARCGNGRVVAEYCLARGLVQHESDDAFAGSTILATNAAVEHYNQRRLHQLDTEVVTFSSSRWGKQRTEWGDPVKPPRPAFETLGWEDRAR